MGALTNPNRAVYNRVYRRVTVDPLRAPRKGRRPKAASAAGCAIIPIFLLLVAFAVQIVGCESAPSSPTDQASPGPQPKILDISVLMGQSRKIVAKHLGKPVEVSKGYPGETICTYKWPEADDAYDLIGSYKGGKLVHLNMFLKHPTATPEDAVKLFGLDVGAISPDAERGTFKHWSGKLKGVRFKEIAATKTDASAETWGQVSADVE
jgi:hypothetical protein